MKNRSLTRFVRIRTAHFLKWPRTLNNSEMRRFARTQTGRVLEIGSGPPRGSRFPYSARHLFDHCEFVCSDIDPSFGHQLVDVTTDNLAGYDAIVCANVLEHVWDFQAAVDNIHRGLPEGGRAFVVTPFAYPLHAEPADFWRFTEHALRRLFSGFAHVEIRRRGWPVAPTLYAVTAVK